MRKISWITTKQIQYYKAIRIMADTGLHDQLATIVDGILVKGSRILDFGAGEGALSQRLCDMGYQVYSVDIDQEKFKARTEFVRLNFDNAEDISLFVREHWESFELVLGIEVIEHLENPWQFIRDLRNLVKKGGWILISTPNITSWFSRVNFFFRGRFHQFEDNDRHYGHINPISTEELKLICERSGLLIEKMIPGGWLPRLWLNRSPTVFLFNLLGFVGSFFMKGAWDGWCLIALLKKQ
jgi:cyclopropane fatty-acyl-phospholipid synthase-like methyltransferase